MKKREAKPDTIKLTKEEVDGLIDKVQRSNIPEKEQEVLVKSLQGMVWMGRMLESNRLTIHKLSKLFGFKSEKLLKCYGPIKKQHQDLLKFSTTKRSCACFLGKMLV
jgi:hypothetical protein